MHGKPASRSMVSAAVSLSRCRGIEMLRHCMLLPRVMALPPATKAGYFAALWNAAHSNIVLLKSALTCMTGRQPWSTAVPMQGRVPGLLSCSQCSCAASPCTCHSCTAASSASSQPRRITEMRDSGHALTWRCMGEQGRQGGGGGGSRAPARNARQLAG